MYSPKIITDINKLILPLAMELIVVDTVKTIQDKKLLQASDRELVGTLTGMGVTYQIEGCSGFMDADENVIGLATTKDYGTIFHEIAHWFQWNEYGEDSYYSSMSNCLYYEQQADAFAKAIHDRLGIGEYKDYYFSKYGINFLREWFKGYIEDDLSEYIKL